MQATAKFNDVSPAMGRWFVSVPSPRTRSPRPSKPPSLPCRSRLAYKDPFSEPGLRLLDLFWIRKTPNQSPNRGKGIGIDLAVRGIEVRKIFYAAFARGLVKDGYDPEEALQEVYRGLLARNNGTCPFDAKKSSFGHYVHIVSRCVLANYIRKEKRRTMYESSESQMSSKLAGDDSFSVQDALDKRIGISLEPGSIERLSQKLAAQHGGDTFAALQMLADGHPVRKVVADLGVERRWLDGVMASARAQLLE